MYPHISFKGESHCGCVLGMEITSGSCSESFTVADWIVLGFLVNDSLDRKSWLFVWIVVNKFRLPIVMLRPRSLVQQSLRRQSMRARRTSTSASYWTVVCSETKAKKNRSSLDRLGAKRSSGNCSTEPIRSSIGTYKNDLTRTIDLCNEFLVSLSLSGSFFVQSNIGHRQRSTKELNRMICMLKENTIKKRDRPRKRERENGSAHFSPLFSRASHDFDVRFSSAFVKETKNSEKERERGRESRKFSSCQKNHLDHLIFTQVKPSFSLIWRRDIDIDIYIYHLLLQLQSVTYSPQILSIHSSTSENSLCLLAS